MSFCKKILSIISKNSASVLVIACLFYAIIFFGISYWKYAHFHYDALDLAIFNQVFYNTSHGRFFQLSIHEPTYLGDHFEPLIILLSFFYRLYQSPLTILFFQTAILSLTAWPLFLIAKRITGKGIWPLIIGLFWLSNPLIQNANLFEFHMLVFAPFMLFWIYYFYLLEKWNLFLWFSFFSLLVREDVSLVVFMFGVLAIIEAVKVKGERAKVKGERLKPALSEVEGVKGFGVEILNRKKLLMGVLVCLVSVVWFFGALKLIGNYAPDSNYKFLLYYSWLGNSIPEIALSIFTKPWQIFKHLITFENLEMFLGLLMSFLFLPLWRRRYLILLIGPLLQILLGSPGGSSLILGTHYNLLFLPALMICSVYTIKFFIDEPVGQQSGLEVVKIISKDKRFLFVIFFVSAIYVSLAIGPLWGFVSIYMDNLKDNKVLQIKKDLLKNIPANASVASTYDFLPNLSTRKKVYSVHYGFIGKKQFSEIDYKIPADTDYLAIDFNDFLLYQFQFPQNPIYSRFFNNADNNIRDLLKKYKLIKIFDNYALFVRSDKDELSSLYSVTDRKPEHEQKVELEDKVDFIGWEFSSDNYITDFGDALKNDLLPISLFWQAKKNLSSGDPEKPSFNYQLKMMVVDDSKVVYEKLYPLGYGILPSSEWPVNQTVQTNYWFYIPKEFKKDENVLQFSLVLVDGYGILNKVRYTEIDYTEKSFLGESVIIGKLGEIVK